MAKINCEACGKSHRRYDTWLECQQRVSRSTCICPSYWRRRWTSHCPDCPLRGTEAT